MSSNTAILSFADPEHPFIRLADQLPWDEIEDCLMENCTYQEPIDQPIRLISGLILLKYIDQLEGEELLEAWLSNPYYQYFTGETIFQWEASWEADEVEYFAANVDPEIIERLLQVCLVILESEGEEDELEEG